jgi:hypothetical protein
MRESPAAAVTAAILAAALPLAGCTLIGLGIGALVDRGSAGKRKPVPTVSVTTLDEGRAIELTLRDGSLITGRYQGLEPVPEKPYGERWRESLQALAGEVSLPGLGPVHVRTKAGAEGDVTLLGLGPGYLSVRAGNAPLERVPLDSLASVSVPGGGSLDGTTLARLAAEGRLPYLEAVVVKGSAGRRSVPLEQVRTTSLVTKNGKKIGAIIGAAIDAALVTAVIIDYNNQPQPKPCNPNTEYCYSCPLVYGDDGHRLAIDAEPLGASLFAADEAVDRVRLGRLAAVDGSYHIQVRDEMRETDYVDAVRLLVVDHAPGTEVLPAMDGSLHAIREALVPSHAVDANGANLAPQLAREDGWPWVELPLFRDPEGPRSRRAVASLEFPRPRGSTAATLALSLRSTEWGAALFGHVLALQGRDVNGFLASLETDPVRRRALRSAWAREALPHVQVWTGREWREAGTLAHIPRLVPGRRALPLDLRDVAGETLRIRIEALPGLWAFDRVNVDYGAPLPLAVQVLSPRTARDADGGDVRELVARSDDRRVTLASMSGRLDLAFDAPLPLPGKARSVLVEIEGYYHPVLEASGEPQEALFERLVHEPGALARYALAGVQPETRSVRGP